jgi:hypothetical protein
MVIMVIMASMVINARIIKINLSIITANVVKIKIIIIK